MQKVTRSYLEGERCGRAVERAGRGSAVGPVPKILTRPDRPIPDPDAKKKQIRTGLRLAIPC
jgi:hypothetical protein